MAMAEELLDSKNPSRKVPSVTGCWGLRYPSRFCYLLTYLLPYSETYSTVPGTIVSGGAGVT